MVKKEEKSGVDVATSMNSDEQEDDERSLMSEEEEEEEEREEKKEEKKKKEREEEEEEREEEEAEEKGKKKKERKTRLRLTFEGETPEELGIKASEHIQVKGVPGVGGKSDKATMVTINAPEPEEEAPSLVKRIGRVFMALLSIPLKPLTRFLMKYFSGSKVIDKVRVSDGVYVVIEESGTQSKKKGAKSGGKHVTVERARTGGKKKKKMTETGAQTDKILVARVNQKEAPWVKEVRDRFQVYSAISNIAVVRPAHTGVHKRVDKLAGALPFLLDKERFMCIQYGGKTSVIEAYIFNAAVCAVHDTFMSHAFEPNQPSQWGDAGGLGCNWINVKQNLASRLQCSISECVEVLGGEQQLVGFLRALVGILDGTVSPRTTLNQATTGDLYFVPTTQEMDANISQADGAQKEQWKKQVDRADKAKKGASQDVQHTTVRGSEDIMAGGPLPVQWAEVGHDENPSKEISATGATSSDDAKKGVSPK